jgi:hypothetical protein
MHTPKKKGGPASNTGTALRQNESLQIPAHGHARKSECPPSLALARPDPGPWPGVIILARLHVLCLPVAIAARLGPQPGLNTALAFIPALLEARQC